MLSFEQLLENAPNPFNADPETHALETQTFNQSLREHAKESLDRQGFHQAVREILARYGLEPELVSVHEFCVGSDGRHEKGVFSPIEMTVFLQYFGRKNSTFVNFDEIERLINDEFRKLSGAEYFAHLDLKYVGHHSLSQYRHSKQLWPERALDAFPILQDEGMSPFYPRVMLKEEMSGELGSKSIEDLRHRTNQFQQITRSGTQRIRDTVLTHYNLDAGEAYFDGVLTRTSLARCSVKSGPLRLLQSAVCREIIRVIRIGDPQNVLYFLLRIPTTTADRIKFLHEAGVLAPGKWNDVRIAQLRDNCQSLLRLYHQSEFKYVRHGGVTVLPFDRKELRERLSDVSAAVADLPNPKLKLSNHLRASKLLASVIPLLTRASRADYTDQATIDEIHGIIRDSLAIDPNSIDNYFLSLPPSVQTVSRPFLPGRAFDDLFSPSGILGGSTALMLRLLRAIDQGKLCQASTEDEIAEVLISALPENFELTKDEVKVLVRQKLDGTRPRIQEYIQGRKPWNLTGDKTEQTIELLYDLSQMMVNGDEELNRILKRALREKRRRIWNAEATRKDLDDVNDEAGSAE